MMLVLHDIVSMVPGCGKLEAYQGKGSEALLEPRGCLSQLTDHKTLVSMIYGGLPIAWPAQCAFRSSRSRTHSQFYDADTTLKWSWSLSPAFQCCIMKVGEYNFKGLRMRMSMGMRLPFSINPQDKRTISSQKP